MYQTFLYFVLLCEKRRESQGVYNVAPLLTRRTGILGAPNLASHLPEAEAILPGHTLIRPSLGMLKSSIKYPHRYLDKGAAVYGNIDNLGIRYDNKNKWVLYSGFRRGLSDYIVVAPVTPNEISENPRFAVSSIVLDVSKNTNFRRGENSVFSIRYADEKVIGDESVENDVNKLQEISAQLGNSDEEPLKIFKSVKKRKKTLEMYPPKSEYIVKQKNNPVSLSYLRSFKDEIQKARIEVKKFIGKMKNITAYAIKQFRGEEKKLLRQQKDDIPSHTNNVTSNSEEKVSKSSGSEEEKINKTESFWASKDAYTHIKLNQEAPKYTDLLPPKAAIGDQIRNWWFYHQDDYVPFEEIND